MAIFARESNRLVYQYDAETLWIEPWGTNSLRIRATKTACMPDEEWALLPPPQSEAVISVVPDEARLRNGNIEAVLTKGGLLTIQKADGTRLLLEYQRNRRDLLARNCSALEIEAREFKPILGGDYHLTMRFESLNPQERIYGMGQYQQSRLNLKGADIELAHRNSQASIPFAVSSLGYGLLWNNPGIGRAVFGTNVMSFEAYATKALDYWVTAGETPAEILEQYAQATGKVPMMPDFAMGFWQCKLRYQTQGELLQVAREYKKRNIPVSVIVVDYFHWPRQGDWRFDPTYWPDPDAMIAELKEMGMELMVSIWPTVDPNSENYPEMLEKGYLIRTDRGVRVGLDFNSSTIHFDATNPEARRFVWETVHRNYYSKGVKIFWLDEAEPEYTVYDFDNFRYHLGSNLQIGNVYPVDYARAFYEGMEQSGQKNIINLLRCAWAGSQRYGALVWSGDIASSFESLRNQFSAGLNMAMSGIPWWTTDIGGFHGGNPDDPAFRELLVRWFQYGAFCPVMRLHGDREPKQPQYGTSGGATCLSGAANEVWSFGEEAYEICKRYIDMRTRMKPYITELMRQAHEKGTPVIRPLFFEFPQDEHAWTVEDAYFFGPDVLVAPVMEADAKKRSVYLPQGSKWIDVWDGCIHQGGQTVEIATPLERIPLFCKHGVHAPFSWN